MSKIFLLLCLTFSVLPLHAESEVALASASLKGQWSGWGSWSYEGTDIECSSMNLSFSEDALTLERIRGYFDCHIVTMEIPDLKFEKNDSSLVIDGNTVGSWSNTRYAWTEVYSEKFIIKVTIEVQGQSLTYHEVWKSKSDEILYDIRGRLFRSESNH